MRKIIIKNKGLLAMEDLSYIGNSSKRGDETKIGQFGSGWKYALAWLLRNSCQPKIYSGLDEITIDTEAIVTARNMFHAIVINGQKTSLTVEMGPKWKGWMALREIVSNAIDEEEHSISVDYGEIAPVEGYTTVVIPANGELMEVLDHYEKYFAFERVAQFSCHYGRVFVKPASTPMVCYRKGIRCYDGRSATMIDFDFANISISEDRIAGIGDIDSTGRKILEQCDNHEVLKYSLLSDYSDFLPNDITEHYKTCIARMKSEGYNFSSDAIPFPEPGAIELRKKWYWELVKAGIFPNPIDEMFRSLKHEFFPVRGYDVEEAELKHYISAICKNCEVFVGIIKSGYAIVQTFSEGNKFFVSENYLKRAKISGDPMQSIACEMLLEQKQALIDLMMAKM